MRTEIISGPTFVDEALFGIGLSYVFHGAVEVTTDGATTTVKFK